jgi:hypothetical protein
VKVAKFRYPGILTDRSRQGRPEWDSEDKQAERLSPESIAQVSLYFTWRWFIIVIVLQAYLYIVNQDKSAWTWELDRATFHFSSEIYLFTML